MSDCTEVWAGSAVSPTWHGWQVVGPVANPGSWALEQSCPIGELHMCPGYFLVATFCVFIFLFLIARGMWAHWKDRWTEREKAPPQMGHAHSTIPSCPFLHLVRISGIHTHAPMFFRLLGPGFEPRSAILDVVLLTCRLWASPRSPSSKTKNKQKADEINFDILFKPVCLNHYFDMWSV